MGGKDAVVVDETADLESAAEGIVSSAFGFQGQKCSAGSRAIIVEKVYDQVLQKVIEKTKKLTMGDVTKPETYMGPVVDENAMKKITEYIEVGKHEGRLVAGGGRQSLQHDHARIGEVPGELLDVADGGPAERVDGLVRVADHDQLGGRQRARVVAVRLPGGVRNQLPDQHVLRMVGVLVLVHQDVPEPAPVSLGDLRERLQQVDRDHDQVVEVHCARGHQAALVLGVRLGQGLVPVVVRPGQERLVVDQLVLQVGHLVQHRLRRMVLRVQVELPADQRHQPL